MSVPARAAVRVVLAVVFSAIAAAAHAQSSPKAAILEQGVWDALEAGRPTGSEEWAFR